MRARWVVRVGGRSVHGRLVFVCMGWCLVVMAIVAIAMYFLRCDIIHVVLRGELVVTGRSGGVCIIVPVRLWGKQRTARVPGLRWAKRNTTIGWCAVDVLTERQRWHGDAVQIVCMVGLVGIGAHPRLCCWCYWWRWWGYRCSGRWGVRIRM